VKPLEAFLSLWANRLPPTDVDRAETAPIASHCFVRDRDRSYCTVTIEACELVTPDGNAKALGVTSRFSDWTEPPDEGYPSVTEALRRADELLRVVGLETTPRHWWQEWRP